MGLARVQMECGWKVKITRLQWWRENNPGSSTLEGRVRKEGEKRGRKTKGVGGRYKGTPYVEDVVEEEEEEEEF
jgi:hypothetical protein